MNDEPKGFLTNIVKAFLSGPLSILVICLAILVGGIALFSTPREEEPQIVVPTADVSVSFPGHSAEEVEQLVTIPLEKLLWQIDGVEHVYSISRRGSAVVTVRFFVGEDRERSIIKLRDKIEANKDLVPPGVRNWIVKPVEIDDVPIVTFTLFSDKLNSYDLRRIAEELKTRLDKVNNISRTEIFGGQKREVRIEPDIEKMAALNVSINDIINSLQANNISKSAGVIVADNKTKSLQFNSLIASKEDIEKTIILKQGQENFKLNDVGLLYKTLYGKRVDKSNRVVRIEDVAKVIDGSEYPQNYLNIGFGPASKYYKKYKGERLNAVTIALSKKKGTNAVAVAQNIINEAKLVGGKILPDNVKMLVTRNYGEIANDKVSSLINSMIFAILSVVLLLYFTLGWRESLVVGLAVPVSFAMALFVNYLFGFTINRVTLFALILSLGLVVDDPITNVDNIQRHIKMGKYNAFNATLAAVHEVLPPVIMSTLAIIISFTPMFFITGMMGPYMGPMAINVPLTVVFSTVCALTFVPWLSFKLLKKYSTYDEFVNDSFPDNDSAETSDACLKENEILDRDIAISNDTVATVGSCLKKDGENDTVGTSGACLKENPENLTPRWIERIYRLVLNPLLNKKRAYIFLGIIVLLLILSTGLLLLKVPLKMLPFDNKDELQLIIDMPEGTSLEQTDRVTQELEKYLSTANEVKDFETYTGVNSPVDFNGLIRHYNFRRQPYNADIRINLASKYIREMQSHAIALRMRNDLQNIARKYNAKLKIVEVPPGPPVISTVTVELRGDESAKYSDIIAGAKVLEERMKERNPVHIVEVDDMAETPYDKYEFVPDKTKLASHGLTAKDIYKTISAAVAGFNAGIVHKEKERNPLLMKLILPLKDRNDINRILDLWVKNRYGKSVQLSELGDVKKIKTDQPIYHKNLERVVYVTAECAGKAPGEIIIDMMFNLYKNPLPNGISAKWDGEGEWQITVRVFRDLGIAFGIALIGIYLLMIVQMKNFFMPLIVMLAIPLTIIGIAPGFYFLNVFAGGKIGLYPDPIFFTATAMIGMIALGGIVIRNSIVLIEFVQDSLAQGKDLKSSLLESGAVRFRPIILTAATTMLGAWPITFDPVFSGLAWSLIFGLISSTVFTLLVIPVVYYLISPKELKESE